MKSQLSILELENIPLIGMERMNWATTSDREYTLHNLTLKVHGFPEISLS